MNFFLLLVVLPFRIMQHSGNLVAFVTLLGLQHKSMTLRFYVLFFLMSCNIPDGSFKVRLFDAMFTLLLMRDEKSTL